jgi:hypothetical protein
MIDILNRFYSRLNKGLNDCLNFGVDEKNSYRNFYLGTNRNTGIQMHIHAHVFAYIFYYKIYPKGQIHHTCENKSCCNPLHLVDVTMYEHHKLHRKQFCKYGHELAEVGQYKKSVCKECNRIWHKTRSNEWRKVCGKAIR